VCCVVSCGVVWCGVGRAAGGGGTGEAKRLRLAD
jgi:hypothetical protein